MMVGNGQWVVSFGSWDYILVGQLSFNDSTVCICIVFYFGLLWGVLLELTEPKLAFLENLSQITTLQAKHARVTFNPICLEA